LGRYTGKTAPRRAPKPPARPFRVGYGRLSAMGATAAEIDELRRAVERAAREPGTIFYQARIHQVRGRRPSVVQSSSGGSARGPSG
jgi:hypothetical protein